MNYPDTELEHKLQPAHDTDLVAFRAALGSARIDFPAKELKAIEKARQLASELAQASPSPSEAAAAMFKAHADGKDPFDTDEMRRYTTARSLLDPDLLRELRREAEAQQKAALDAAIPKIIEATRERSKDAGERIAAAVEAFGVTWHTVALNSGLGDRAATLAHATEAVKDLRRIAGVWSTFLRLPGNGMHVSDKWLIFAEADPDNLASPQDRQDPLWLILRGKAVDMATLDSLPERVQHARELTEARQRRADAAQQDANTRHLNRTR